MVLPRRSLADFSGNYHTHGEKSLMKNFLPLYFYGFRFRLPLHGSLRELYIIKAYNVSSNRITTFGYFIQGLLESGPRFGALKKSSLNSLFLIGRFIQKSAYALRLIEALSVQQPLHL